MNLSSIFDKRISNLKKEMTCDVSIFISRDFNQNVFYFTGFTGYGILIIYKNKKSVFLTTKLDLCNLQNKNLDVVVLEKRSSEILKKTVKKGKIVGFDYSALSVNSFSNIKKTIKPKKCVDVSNIMLKLREKKDDLEIETIKKACKVACEILGNGIKKIRGFNYEFELKQFLELEVKKRGYDVAFDTIVASGKNSANAHYSSCENRIQKGFMVIDFGVKIGKYHSDITRTVYVGKPSKEEICEYDKVLAVQKECIELAKDVKSCEELYALAKKKLGEPFIHGLGHGVGLEIHELPNLTSNNKNQILDKSCFTIEPGVYYPNRFGIRIEDTVAKMDCGLKILTLLPKGLICINHK